MIPLEHLVETLRAVPLFAQMEAEALKILAFSADVRPYRAGDALFEHGTNGDRAFLILSGEVEAIKGRSVARYGPGTLLGKTALFTVVKRDTTLRARTPVDALVISRQLMLRALEAYPHSAQRIRTLLADDLAQVTRAVLSHAAK